MVRLLKELDTEVETLQSQCFAPNTTRTYATHRRTYMRFCELTSCVAVPVSVTSVCRYAAFLGRTRAFSTVKQYLNIVRIVHQELGFDNPLADNYNLTMVLRGLRRKKGDVQLQKDPLTPSILMKIRSRIDLDSILDAQFWAGMVCCFFGLLRVSSVTAHPSMSCDSPHLLRRRDIIFSAQGCTLRFRGSKTIQFRERTFDVTLPYFANHPLCPVTAVIVFLRMAGQLPVDFPAFACRVNQKLRVLSASVFRARLRALLRQIGLSEQCYNTHSLRRGGATWLLMAGVSVPVIKILGDWKSDAVLRYLKPDTRGKFQVLSGLSHTLPSAPPNS
jgi:hypothetical protein